MHAVSNHLPLLKTTDWEGLRRRVSQYLNFRIPA